jgi:hypothetical protein
LFKIHGTFFVFFCSFFVRPKKEPKKGRRKRKIQPFCPPATQSLNGATKKVEFRAVSDLPSRHLNTND